MRTWLSRNWKTAGLWIFTTLLLTACGSANKDVSNSPEYPEIVQEVKDLDFEIEHQWANPTQYGRVDLLGNPNRIKFENDSVEVYLPFFGERYAGGGYDPDEGAIQYKGVPKNLEITENPQKGEVRIFFEGNRGTEILDFRITVYPNRVARTSVTSSQRETIIYDGKILNP